jgi:DNA-binding GntR family transcriptional regulator
MREIYPILGALESAAIELADECLRALAPWLSAINARLSKETHKARRYELDREFHRVLTGICDNERLLQLLEQHCNHARRIDGGHARAASPILKVPAPSMRRSSR